MNDAAREKLREIVNRHGEEILRDRNRCESLLKDHCAGCRLETSALMGAHEERVPLELTSSWQSAMTPEAMRARLVQRLHDHRGLTPQVADWAVDAWSYALGVNLGRISDPVDQPLVSEESQWVDADQDDVPVFAQPPPPPVTKPASQPERRNLALVAAVALVLLLGVYATGFLGSDVTDGKVANQDELKPVQKTLEELLYDAAIAGMAVTLRTDKEVDSRNNSVGQHISATLIDALVVDGQEILPVGAPALLRVTRVVPGGRLKGVPEIEVKLVQLTANGQAYPVASQGYVARGKSRGKDTAAKTGAGGGIGAAVGGLLGKGKGAAVGAVAGASGALGLQVATKAPPAVIRAEEVIRFTLQAPPSAKAKEAPAAKR